RARVAGAHFEFLRGAARAATRAGGAVHDFQPGEGCARRAAVDASFAGAGPRTEAAGWCALGRLTGRPAGPAAARGAAAAGAAAAAQHDAPAVDGVVRPSVAA